MFQSVLSSSKKKNPDDLKKDVQKAKFNIPHLSEVGSEVRINYQQDLVFWSACSDLFFSPLCSLHMLRVSESHENTLLYVGGCVLTSVANTRCSICSGMMNTGWYRLSLAKVRGGMMMDESHILLLVSESEREWGWYSSSNQWFWQK